MLRASRFFLLSVLVAAAACKSRTETVAQRSVRSIDPPSAPGAMAPNLRESSDGVLATWLEPGASDGHRLRFSRWANRAWSAPVTLVESARIVANWADVPSVARDGSGALVAHWAETVGSDKAHAYDAIVARSIDGGATWKRLGALNDDGTATEHGFVSLLGEANGVRAFWLDGRATLTEGGAMTLRTALVGERVAASELVDDRVCDCCGTAAVATADGAVVAYRDRAGDETRDIAVARGGAARWTQPAAVHHDGWQITGCPVNGPALAARGRQVAVAWYTYAESTHRVRVAFSDDGGASFAAPIEVDAPRGGRAPLGRVSLALADDDSAVVGFLASDREDAAVLLRRVNRDGARSAELSVGTQLAGRDAGFPRLARDGDALVVSWTESGPAPRLRAAEVPLSALPLTGTRLDERQAPSPPSAPSAPSVAVGTPAPALQAVGLDGAPTTLSALRGRVVLVNLWAIWCEPCRQELPVLASLHERDAARGLSIVAINVDRKRTRDEIADFVARRKLPFTIWLDPEDRAALAFGATTFPFNVLVDREGRVVWSRAGAIRDEDPELRAALEAALR